MLRNMLISAVLLALFAIVGTTLVATTHNVTAERIALNERQALLSALHTLIPPDSHDNDIFSDYIEVRDPRLLGTRGAVTVYRARQNGEPVAAVLTPVAPDGYGGAIKLLVAVRYDGTVAGVRVMSHHETPGLGDKIEREKSDWITTFEGKSLDQPPRAKWKVQKDGGVFDQFTGATITPRAVVSSVYNALRYYNAHREEIFQRPAQPGTEQPEGLGPAPAVEARSARSNEVSHG